MMKKKKQIERIIYAIAQAKDSCVGNDFNIERFSDIMQLITKNDFAEKRYGFYEKFSVRQKEWYQWRFDNLELKEKLTILDVGSGYGSIWLHGWEQIPEGCTIVMLDKDDKGRGYFKKFVEDNSHRLKQGVTFEFWNADAENVNYEKEKYDRILANHFWEYVKDKKNLMKQLWISLKADGKLCSSLPSWVSKEDVEGIITDFFPKRVKTNINETKVLEKKK